MGDRFRKDWFEPLLLAIAAAVFIWTAVYLMGLPA